MTGDPAAFLLPPDPGFWNSPEGKAALQRMREELTGPEAVERARRQEVALGNALLPAVRDMCAAVARLVGMAPGK